MTLVLGWAKPDSVLLVADSRQTWGSSSEQHADNVKKIFAVRGGALAFSGNLYVASLLLRALMAHTDRQDKDTEILRSTVERLFQQLYPKAVERADELAGFKIDPRVAFMVASLTPTGEAPVALDILTSPEFHPESILPFTLRAIGSGSAIVAERAQACADSDLPRINDVVLQAGYLRVTIPLVLLEYGGPQDVGDLYHALNMTPTGPMLVSMSLYSLDDDTAITMAVEEGRRWVQINERTGKKIELKCPWEVRAVADHVFADLEEILERGRDRHSGLGS